MSTQITGTVQSGTGGYPLENVTVTLYEAVNGPGTVLGSARTDVNGRFTIATYRGTATTIFYATARVSDRVVLMTVIGVDEISPIVINEMTTVAAAFSMAQFANDAMLEGGAGALRTAAAMCGNLADPSTGQPSQVLVNPPNADQTSALRSIRSLGNMAAAVVRQRPGFAEAFFALATPPGGTAPTDTFQALLNIARNPANNVGPLFTQSQGVPSVYSPPLAQAPDAWTLCVKVNNSGDVNYLFGGPANIAFDGNGFAWIANNVVQGTPDSGTFIMVLQPDGTPAVGTWENPVKSPVFGGGLKGPGWGITIDPNGHVWVGNFGWGVRKENPFHGSVSEFRPDGTPVSGQHGHQQETHRVQATVADADGNVWMASYGNGRVVCFPGGDPEQAIWAESGSNPFGIAVQEAGTAWVTNGGGLGWPDANPGTLTRFRIVGEGADRRLEKTLDVGVGYATKVVVLDAQGYAWVASSGDSKVYRVSPDGDVSAGFDGGGIDTPWGLAVDGDDD
ncbi:MAG TPA: hypothetical protein VFY65_13730, partial [Longimicrobium sp.]|nr:hypothetical protein [Longimicrobium sp.]